MQGIELCVSVWWLCSESICMPLTGSQIFGIIRFVCLVFVNCESLYLCLCTLKVITFAWTLFLVLLNSEILYLITDMCLVLAPHNGHG